MMTKAQIATLPVPDGRKAERRIVNLAARLREPGASLTDVELRDLSTGGFRAEGPIALEPGSIVWLKLTGIEATQCRLVWREGEVAGFEFLTPLHRATLELVTRMGRKPPPKRHFGPQGWAGR